MPVFYISQALSEAESMNNAVSQLTKQYVRYKGSLPGTNETHRPANAIIKQKVIISCQTVKFHLHQQVISPRSVENEASTMVEMWDNCLYFIKALFVSMICFPFVPIILIYWYLHTEEVHRMWLTIQVNYNLYW
jgi:hypothetical protein